jgi:adenylate cyclase
MGSRRFSAYLALLLGSVLLSILLYLSGPLQYLEYRITDELYDIRGPIDISESPIVIVEISQTADEEIPFKYPWPTGLHAKLVENLNRAGASVIGFDVIFDQPDIYDPQNDTLFAQSLQKYGNVFLAADILSEQVYQRSLQRGLLFPIPVLRDANPNPTALVETLTELDGKVRRYIFGRNVEITDEIHYMLAWELVRHHAGLSGEDFSNTNEAFGIGDYLVNKDSGNSFLINYHATPYSFPMVSFEEVIDDSSFLTNFEKEAFDVNKFDNEFDGLLQQGIFKDKIVLVGATMPTLQDFHSTPFPGQDKGMRIPGVEIHANAIQSILNGNFLSRMEGWQTVLVTFLFSLVVILINYRWNYLYGISGSVVLILLYSVGGYQLFAGQNYLVIFTAPVLSLLIAQGGTGFYEYLITRKEKARIQGMFASYVSPALVQQMIESGEEPKLGGEEKEVTAFFSDIASFSAFSEQLDAQKLVQLINEYLSEMTDILTDEGGTLDKYIGDAIVGFFGAPVMIEHHAYHACIAAQRMQLKQAELRDKWKADGWPEVVSNMRTRIGLNTGKMVTGNMGSDKRFNYTMMGDNVNLAARCESGAKIYGVYTMVTEPTKEAAEAVNKDRLVFRYLDNIVVMGRKQPVKMYEIMCFREDETQEITELLGLFQQGIDAYQQQHWDAAISKFEITAQLEPLRPGMPGIKTNPSEMYIDRCRSMKELPPIEAWDGVFRMKSK